MPIHQCWKYCVPVATIEPHSGSGGWAPSPRNERPDEQQDRRAEVEGREHEHRPRDVRQHVAERGSAATDTPSRRADWTYSESPIESTRPRTTRAYAGQATMTIASTAFRSPRPSTAVTTIARMIAGNAKTRSVTPHHDAVRHAAEVAGDRAEQAADRGGEGHEQDRERDRDARAIDDAAEHVAAELVGAEGVIERWRLERGECLGERVVRRDQRREDRDDQPHERDRRARDRERLAPDRRTRPPRRGPGQGSRRPSLTSP